MLCPNCNAEVSDGTSFCENCGSRLVPEDAVQSAQTAAVVTPLDQSSDGVDVFVTDSATSQQEQSYGAYDATQQQPYGYDATQQQPYGYDATQQQPYSYDPNQQQAYGYDPNQQQAYGYDPNQQQSYGYDATQQQPYGSGQPGYQAPQGNPYAAPAGQPYGYAQPVQQVSKAPFVLSIIALVLSVIGLFPVSIVLAIIALVMNSGQKKRGEISTKQTPTTIMSVISLVLSVLMAVLTAIVGGAIWAAIVSGEFDTHTHSSTTSSAVSTSSKSASAAADASPTDPVGTWVADSMSYDGTEYTSEDMAAMREYGMDIHLVINKDGTVVLDMFGVTEKGTWADKGGGVITITFSGDSADVTIAGGELTLVDGKDKLVFVKEG